MEITIQDLTEYKKEIQETKEKIETSKENGLIEIDKKVVEYKEKLVSEFDAQVQKDLDKCEIEEAMIDKIIENKKKDEDIL